MTGTQRRPTQAFSPVETLTEELYARFAESIGLGQDTLTAELEGNLTPTTLRRLAAATGLSEEFWANLSRAWVERTPTESESDMSEKTPTQRGIDAIRADTLHKAAADLRAMGDNGPYAGLSGQVSDDWGNTCGDIDNAYARWLEQRAEDLER